MVNKSSSRRWLKEHFSDPYVKQAQQLGYRSRAVFKLLQIDERDHLFKPGMTVIDLGAAPGGWSQLVIKRIHPKGHLIALDILPMEPIPGVEFIQGDFTDEKVVQDLLSKLENDKNVVVSTDESSIQVVDWVISDMAPNMSGNEVIDIPRVMYMAELALDFALKVIKPEGGILLKTFQGDGFDTLLTDIKRIFRKVSVRKPKASRGRSKEVYILAKERKN